MKFLAHHFSPALNEIDRWNIVKALGLGELDFIFVECRGSEVLSLSRICGGQRQMLIPKLRQKLEELAATVNVPLACLQINDQPFRLSDRNARLSLTEELLPFPYSTFFRQSNDSLRIFDDAFMQGFNRLAYAFQHLEDLVSQNEFTFVTFAHGRERIAGERRGQCRGQCRVQCRSVKGRRFHVGRSIESDRAFGELAPVGNPEERGRVSWIDVRHEVSGEVLPLNRAERVLMAASIRRSGIDEGPFLLNSPGAGLPIVNPSVS